MNACVDNGFAYLFYLTGVRKSLSVSASLLVFADTAGNKRNFLVLQTPIFYFVILPIVEFCLQLSVNQLIMRIFILRESKKNKYLINSPRILKQY